MKLEHKYEITMKDGTVFCVDEDKLNDVLENDGLVKVVEDWCWINKSFIGMIIKKIYEQTNTTNSKRRK